MLKISGRESNHMVDFEKKCVTTWLIPDPFQKTAYSSKICLPQGHSWLFTQVSKRIMHNTYLLILYLIIFSLTSARVKQEHRNLYKINNRNEVIFKWYVDKITRYQLLEIFKKYKNRGIIIRFHGESASRPNEKTSSLQPYFYPNSAYPIISDFRSNWGALGGWRYNYYKESTDNYFYERHGGIDFYMPSKRFIIAAADGKIIGIKHNDKCVGNQFAIKFNINNLIASHLHVGRIFVHKGQKIKRGQILAFSGGIIRGKCGAGVEHLHFHLSRVDYKYDMGSGTYRFLGGPENYVDPHLFWVVAGRPECYEKGLNYGWRNRLTLPFMC